MSQRRMLILGGSTRAAADSVRRAGWQPVCADIFADLDLQATAEVIPTRHYPDSFPEDVAQVQADGWFYTGALENHPDVIEQMLARVPNAGPLWGSPPDPLKQVRDPFWLSEILRQHRLPTLDVVSQSTPPALDGGWLQKPLASAGGRLIRKWNRDAASNPFPELHYFQAPARGLGLSVMFRIDNGHPEWLGASQELDASPHSQPPTLYFYCGSFGPMETLPRQARGTLIRMARTLARHAPGLRGLVGLDFRLDGDSVWLTEVNPRYTASVEVLELASGRSFLNPEMTSGQPGHAVVVKQILYASSTMTAPDLSDWLPGSDPWQVPFLADIPVAGGRIESGWPICTVMAYGDDPNQAQQMLEQRLTLIRNLLRSGESAAGSAG